MVFNEAALPPRGILEVLGRVLLVVTMGHLLVFYRDTGWPAKHRTFIHSEEKGEKPVCNIPILTSNFILLKKKYMSLFSKCSEFARNATTHCGTLFCLELYLDFLAILENYTTKINTAEASCHQYNNEPLSIWSCNILVILLHTGYEHLIASLFEYLLINNRFIYWKVSWVSHWLGERGIIHVRRIYLI